MTTRGGRPPRRFVVTAPGASEGATVPLTESDAHHATRVLRLRAGAAVIVTTPSGTFDGVLADVAGAMAVRLSRRRDEPGDGLRIELAVGMAHAAAMEDAFRAAVEMGVSRLLPVLCERGEHAGAEVMARRMSRWRRIVSEAVKQCRRGDIPEVDAPVTVGELARREARTKVLTVPGSAAAPALALRDSCLLAVGPEGGFAPPEEAMLLGAGFVPLGLGPHVLRVPTAVVAALATVRALRGSAAQA